MRDEPLVLHTASRHGVAELDALHAWAFAVDSFVLDDGMVVHVGPTRAGHLLEIGVVQWHATVAIVHAMPARARFLR